MFLNIQIDWIILKTYDQQFTLTTKKSLYIIFKCYDTVSWRTKKHPACKITCFSYHQRLSFWRTCYSVQCRLTPEKGWLLSLDWVEVLRPTRHKIHPPDNHHSSDDVYWRGEEKLVKCKLSVHTRATGMKVRQKQQRDLYLLHSN